MGWKLYDVLDIPKNASKEDIKKAYKKKAVETHPDKGGDPEKFKEVNNAYSVLNDENQKIQYDQLGDEGFNRNGGGNGGMNVDPNDIFSQFFGNGFNFHFNHQNMRQEKTRRSDHNHIINIKLHEAYSGFKKNIRVILNKTCHKCGEKCYACQGRGQITEMHRMGFFTQMITRPCPTCNGSGISVKGKEGCTECKGLGAYNDEKIIEINIPAGVDNGFHIRYKGFGEQSRTANEISGDLIIEIQVIPHENFVRQGNDLLLKLPISLKHSIVGTQIFIEHFSGNFHFNTHDISVIQNMKPYTIKNKGMPIRNTQDFGNMIITFEIQYPLKKITIEEAKRIDELFDELGL